MQNESIAEFVKDVNAHLNNIICSMDRLKSSTSKAMNIRLLNNIHSAADCITELVDGESFEGGNKGIMLQIVED